MTNHVASLDADTTYYYRFYGTNSAGHDWADEVGAFLTGELRLEASDPSATEGADTGAFTIYRPATATNAPFTVTYTISGTADNIVDYDKLTGSVTIPEGATNADITVTPVVDAGPESDETVVLTLDAGPYVLGTPFCSTVTIYNAAPAGTNYWTGTGSDYWSDPTKWSEGYVPLDGQSVVITNHVKLAASTASLGSYWLAAGKTNTFEGTNTILYAVDVSVSGVVTHAENTDASSPWVMNNRVRIVCTNLTVPTNGSINVDGKGFQGGQMTAGKGPGGGANVDNWYTGAGGGYGGAGGDGDTGLGGTNYGSLTAPVDCGSGGAGGNTYVAGAGGGSVWIEASSTVTVYGFISANGTQGTASDNGAGGGSGGGIYITCRELAGTTNGIIRANGASATGTGADIGGGGGGRIAVVFDPASQTGNPGVRFSVSPGSAIANGRAGEWGTVCFPSPAFLSETLQDQLFNQTVLHIGGGFTSWAPDRLTVSNCSFRFGQEGFRLSVTNAVNLLSSGYLGISADSVLRCASLTLTNSGRLYGYSSVTNWTGSNCSALVEVQGDMIVTTNCWVYPYSDPTNGSAVKFQVANLFVGPGGGFNADAKGYYGGGGGRTAASSTDGYGPGKGAGPSRGTGGGHGGIGGDGAWQCLFGADYATWSGTNGCATNPVVPGSGGGGGSGDRGGRGGGVIWIEASGTATIHGTLTANGGECIDYGAGGAGGGILVRCQQLAGSGTGLLRAYGGRGKGADGYGSTDGDCAGGGGGGRIAVIYDTGVQAANPGVRFQAYGAAGFQSGQRGTVYLPNTLFLSGTQLRDQWLNVQVQPEGVTSWAYDSLLISNSIVVLGGGEGMPVAVTVTNTLRIDGSGALNLLAGQTLTCGNLLLTNGGYLQVYAANTTTNQTNQVGLVDVTGNLVIGSGSWVYPWSDPTNGGYVLFRAGSVSVLGGGGFNADSRGHYGGGGVAAGYSVGWGEGKGGATGGRGGGAGHGGAGSAGSAGAGGPTYGYSNAPLHAGSGGGGGQGGAVGNTRTRAGRGGGAIRILTTGNALINGTLTANAAKSISYGGGGAGGTIWITCKELSGSGTNRANGGHGNGNAPDIGGGGGGGRIALHYAVSNDLLTCLVNPGTGNVSYVPNRGDTGTVFRLIVQPAAKGSVLTIR